jgi:copper(I)-binding protein
MACKPTPVRFTGRFNLYHLAAGIALVLLVLMAQVRAADLVVQNAWIRALPSSVPSGGYFTLHNGGTKLVVLTGAESPGCGMLMLHKSEDKGGMSAMMDVSELPIPAGETLKFAPGGYHLMCMDARPVIKPGATVPVTLNFKDGGKLTVPFAVRNASGQ